MAETTEGKNQNSKVNPESKYMRLQEVGLSMVLAIPFALMAGETFGIIRALIVQVCVLLFYGGFACFVLGHEKRREIQAQNNKDCPKKLKIPPKNQPLIKLKGIIILPKTVILC